LSDRKGIQRVKKISHQKSPTIVHWRPTGVLAEPVVISGKIGWLNKTRKY